MTDLRSVKKEEGLNMINKKSHLIIRVVFALVMMVVFLSACMGPVGGGGASGHCSEYKYDKNKGSWVDAQGQPVLCTIADGERIFEYLPGKGCSLWSRMHQSDESVHMSELVIRTGTTAKKYCVLQRYFERDHSGQVLILGGAFCLTQIDNKREYAFLSCDGVERKNPNIK